MIASDRAAPREAKGARVLTIAADPDAADGKDRIYRYDRAGLMLALKSAGAGRGRDAIPRPRANEPIRASGASRAVAFTVGVLVSGRR